MKFLAVLLCLMVALTLGLLSIIHSRRTLEVQLTKTSHFESVKNKVSSDVLKETKTNVAEATIRLDQTKKQLDDLAADVKAAQEAADGKKSEMKTCNDDLSQIKSELGALEAEVSKTDTEFQQKKASLSEQINNLKTELEKPSKVCEYIIKSSADGMKLCGVPQADQKPEAAKPT